MTPDNDNTPSGVNSTKPEERADPFEVGLEDSKRGGWFNYITTELMPGFPISADDVIVDVGCGDGGVASFCAHWGAHIILTDVNAGRVQESVDRLASSPARKVESFVAEASALPLPDRHVTRVVCTEVLEHVDDPQAALAEMVRVGQPGALYLITVPAAGAEHLQKHFAPDVYFQKPNHIRIIESNDFASLVEGAGLKIEHRSSSGFFWAMWWLLFWEASVPLEHPSHPMLDAWTKTWSEVMKVKNGAKIKRVLDSWLPKTEVIVARKPDQP